MGWGGQSDCGTGHMHGTICMGHSLDTPCVYTGYYGGMGQPTCMSPCTLSKTQVGHFDIWYTALRKNNSYSGLHSTLMWTVFHPDIGFWECESSQHVCGNVFFKSQGGHLRFKGGKCPRPPVHVTWGVTVLE